MDLRGETHRRIVDAVENLGLTKGLALETTKEIA
jgi:hypothetical protein